jgi:PilZ domain
MEHRWGQRAGVCLRTRLICRPYAIGVGWLSELSLSGAFIRTDLAPVTLSHVDIVFDGPESGGSPREAGSVVGARVVRTQPDGVGVEWDELAPAAVTAMLGPVGHDDAVLDMKRRSAQSARSF